jgi:CRISPR-associated exonuclease Cas4
MSSWLLVLVLAGLAIFFGLAAVYLRRRSGISDGRIVAADSSFFRPLQAPLVDSELGLVGKPDYLMADRNGHLVPVEYKNTLAPPRPYAGHVLQLAAYLRLVQVQEGKRPAYGLIRYRDKTFRVDYSSELEDSLMDCVANIREAEEKADLPERSHQEAARCRACGYQELCEQRIRQII